MSATLRTARGCWIRPRGWSAPPFGPAQRLKASITAKVFSRTRSGLRVKLGE